MKKRKMMRKSRNDSAVVGVIEAVLLIGLVVLIIGIIQTVYVPEWMSNIESDHLNDVSAQFSSLKYTTDIQLSSQETNLTISSPLTLGSDKIPYLLSERAYGSINILVEGCTLRIENASESINHTLGILRYDSQNSYFVNQVYSYELGAIIMDQDTGSLLSIPPHFSVDVDASNINITFTCVNISSIGDKISASGYSSTAVTTRYLPDDDNTTSLTNVTSFRINTTTPYAWQVFLNQTLINNNLQFGSSNDFYFTVAAEYIILHLTLSRSNHFILAEKTIQAQIAPGWIS